MSSSALVLLRKTGDERSHVVDDAGLDGETDGAARADRIRHHSLDVDRGRSVEAPPVDRTPDE
jgi:hypothetical protein